MMTIVEKLSIWFIIFMAYSFGGWLIEVSLNIINHKKLVNRGFLIGPICPIYGTGAVAISLLLDQAESPIAVFCVAVVGGAILEYTTSYIMERLFRVRWWDYSDKMVQINGRICMSSVLCFGVAGVLIVSYITPFLQGVLTSLPPIALYITAGVLAGILILDLSLSLWLIMGVRVTVGTVQRDATEEISTRVQEILTDKGKLNRRLVKAFPNQSPSRRAPRKPRQPRQKSQK